MMDYQFYDDDENYEPPAIRGIDWDFCPVCGQNTVEMGPDFMYPMVCEECQMNDLDAAGYYDNDDEDWEYEGL